MEAPLFLFMVDRDAIQKQVENCLKETDFKELGEKYRGKVRDCYTKGERRIFIATDRISAFDHILKEQIPLKGQVLNQIAAYFFEQTKDICPNHVIDVPDPSATVGKLCTPYPVEMVVRGYLAGHAWRTYEKGDRKLCGVPLPEGMKMNQKFPKPIITPTTKAKEGHDIEITRQQIIDTNVVPELIYEKMEKTALALFQRGTELAAKRGLILVDTKYEFGDYHGELTLIDEVHTPDSSRYWYKETYKKLFEKGEPQKQLSKEFLREWLISKNFMGKEGQEMPTLDTETRVEIASRYIEIFELLTGQGFAIDPTPVEERIRKNLAKYFIESAA